MKKTYSFSMFAVFAVLAFVFSPLISRPALAQQGETIQLSVSKVFGYSSGFGQAQREMQGTFTVTARGPQNLERVIFFLDNEVMGEVQQEPFRLQFQTEAYTLGKHRFTATGYTTDGRQLNSNIVTATFVTAGQGMEAGMRIVLPLFALIFGIIGLSALLSVLSGRNQKPVPAGAPRNYGIMGGTICPKCKRPAPFAFWSINVLFGKLQMCPHCKKWSVVRRASPAELRSAELAELEREQQAAHKAAPIMSEEDRLRKELEGSRFND